MSILTGRSPQERLWMLAGGLGAFVLLLIGYFFFISPQRSHTASVNAQADTVRTTNAALETRIQGLQVQSHDMIKYKAQLAAADAALPSTGGVPAFLRSLQSLGTLTHTDAVDVTVGAPTDLSPVVAAPTTTDTTSTDTSSTDTSSSDTTTPDPASTTATDPTGVTTAGVYGLPITAQVTGSDSALNKFLQQLQEVQPRAVLITQITEGTTATGASGSTQTGNSLQLTMQAFVAPTSGDETAALASAAGS